MTSHVFGVKKDKRVPCTVHILRRLHTTRSHR